MSSKTEILEAQFRAGYRPPQDNQLVCRKCGARKLPRAAFQKYFCLRHNFYVHSNGYCPSFGTEKYIPPNKPKPSPYKQQELFK